jgi:predicted deacylase
MHEHLIPLIGAAPGARHHLRVLRFGPPTTPGGRAGATIQASLHADEVPPMLVASKLTVLFTELEARGELAAEVRLAPAANPVGLSQMLLGQHVGRFAFGDGGNFNRGFPDLAGPAGDALEGRLGDDPAVNERLVRDALRAAAEALPATHTVQDLKRRLLQLAIGSEVVLDLHCDSQAVMHLYALTPHEADATALGALLGAEAVLLATESGDNPFDEATSRPWLALQQRFAPHPVPLATFATTVELRGQSDVHHADAEADARAIVEFLRRRGIVTGTPAPLPAPRCSPTPLAASEPVTAPCAGVVVHHVEPGRRVEAGQGVADVVDVETGQVTTLRAQSSGVLYARGASRWAEPGQRLAKIAGTTLVRQGKLLSP